MCACIVLAGTERDQAHSHGWRLRGPPEPSFSWHLAAVAKLAPAPRGKGVVRPRGQGQGCHRERSALRISRAPQDVPRGKRDRPRTLGGMGGGRPGVSDRRSPAFRVRPQSDAPPSTPGPQVGSVEPARGAGPGLSRARSQPGVVLTGTDHEACEDNPDGTWLLARIVSAISDSTPEGRGCPARARASPRTSPRIPTAY